MTTPIVAFPAGTVLVNMKDVCYSLGGLPILKGLDLQILNRARSTATTGQVVGVLGPSGIGKTRILRLLAGLDVADSGVIDGPILTPRSRIGVVFQHYPLLKHRVVMDNMLVAGAAAGMTQAASKERATHLLGRFGLMERAKFFPAQLSGGQRQRVAIAQQLMSETRLLLMDEPFSGLDPRASHDLLMLLEEVAHHHDLNTIVLITHDVHAAMLASDTLFMVGRDKDQPGARVQHVYDMAQLGFAWRHDLDADPAFGALEREVKAYFSRL